jgi:drug/metabolite transporter (DMT)-like permease
VSGSEIGRSGPSHLAGGVLVLLGAGSWAAGSLVARYGAHPPSAAMGNGMQMLSGGAALLVLGLLAGEATSFNPSNVSLSSVLALLYLTIFGSLLAFSSYIWLLRNTTPRWRPRMRTSTRWWLSFLGWALAAEPLSGRTGLAAFVILSSVVMITARPSAGGSAEGRFHWPVKRLMRPHGEVPDGPDSRRRRVALVAGGAESLGYRLRSRDPAPGARVPSDGEAKDGP